VLGDQVFYTISEQIVQQIKNDIFNGKLQPGESLREVPMAKKYNVSRGPVRDALKVLSKEGFLIAKPNVGVTVAPPPSDEVVKEIIVLRRQLERFALYNTLDNYTAEDIDTLKQIMSKMREACVQNDNRAFVTMDLNFHKEIVKKHDDRHLLGIWNELVFRMMFNYNRLTHLMDSCEEHENILRAIESKNIELAIELLEKNIQ